MLIEYSVDSVQNRRTDLWYVLYLPVLINYVVVLFCRQIIVSFFQFLKPQTGNDARAHYLQDLAMPALVRKRGRRCPRPLFTALRDARASRHGCPRCEFTVFAMPALQDTDARAVNSLRLRCPRFKTRMPAL